MTSENYFAKNPELDFTLFISISRFYGFRHLSNLKCGLC